MFKDMDKSTKMEFGGMVLLPIAIVLLLCIAPEGEINQTIIKDDGLSNYMKSKEDENRTQYSAWLKVNQSFQSLQYEEWKALKKDFLLPGQPPDTPKPGVTGGDLMIYGLLFGR